MLPAAPKTGVYCLRLQVTWGDCDPAGIVYFPRFFEKFHETMERWFGDALRVPYRALIVDRCLGVPSVHTEADFRVPCLFGEWLRVELSVGRLGRSSVELHYAVYAEPEPESGTDGEESPRLVGKTVCVLMDLDPTHETYRQALPWPEELRERIEAFGVIGDSS